MYISIGALKRSKPANVIRLAIFMGIVTWGRLLEDIVDEIVEKTNGWVWKDGSWHH